MSGCLGWELWRFEEFGSEGDYLRAKAKGKSKKWELGELVGSVLKEKDFLNYTEMHRGSTERHGEWRVWGCRVVIVPPRTSVRFHHAGQVSWLENWKFDSYI
ncbi:hypothetical protein [Shivajiella indica]|uniref:Uncharacterized protein n=1 Tax=Shivajiella indica TaxID=872115 RepID=A0ABW5B7F7_9BACT